MQVTPSSPTSLRTSLILTLQPLIAQPLNLLTLSVPAMSPPLRAGTQVTSIYLPPLLVDATAVHGHQRPLAVLRAAPVVQSCTAPGCHPQPCARLFSFASHALVRLARTERLPCAGTIVDAEQSSDQNDRDAVLALSLPGNGEMMDEGRNNVTEGQELHLHTGVGKRVCTCVGRGESEAGWRSCVRRCSGPVAHTCDGAGGWGLSFT